MRILELYVFGCTFCSRQNFLKLLLASFSSLFILTTELHASETSPSTQPLSNPQSIDFLEGKSFEGEIGVLGEPAHATDLVIFQDGQFTSKNCQERCGYTSGDYWIRRAGNQINIKALTPCLTADATILWEGSVTGDQIEGKFTWTNNRWYWTFQKEFWFKGKLVGTDGAQSTQSSEVE
jgi:hypothetical protein